MSRRKKRQVTNDRPCRRFFFASVRLNRATRLGAAAQHYYLAGHAVTNSPCHLIYSPQRLAVQPGHLRLLLGSAMITYLHKPIVAPYD